MSENKDPENPCQTASPNSQDTALLPMTNQTQSPLLSLPKELRNIIYTYIFLISPTWIRLDTASALDAPLFQDCCSPLDDSHAVQLYGLILSCRQLYAETMHFYYPTTTFYMYNFNAGMRRIARMPRRSREALTDVRVCLSPRAEREVFGASPGVSVRAWKESSLFQLVKGLEQEGIELEEGVLRIGDAPECDAGMAESEYAKVTALFGRGPTVKHWRGENGRDALRRSWTWRTKELGRYQSVVKHAVLMGQKGERMKDWAEKEDMGM